MIDTQGVQHKTYKMTFAGAPGTFTYCKQLAALAFLQYGNSTVDQKVKPIYAEAISTPGYHLNPLTTAKLPAVQFPIHLANLRAAQPELRTTGQPNKTFYLQVGESMDQGASINNIQFRTQTLDHPLLSQADDIDKNMFCNPAYSLRGLLCNSTVDKHKCKCFHILEIELGDVVEIFILNPAGDMPIAHTLHLHGYSYSVVGSGRIPDDSPMKYVRKENEAGNILRNLNTPPKKDSAQTVPGAYIIFRFEADNPGYWIMHCHFSFDQIDGQIVVFKVGVNSNWSIPKNFSQC